MATKKLRNRYPDPRGKPKKYWLDQKEEDMQDMSPEEWRKKYETSWPPSSNKNDRKTATEVAAEQYRNNQTYAEWRENHNSDYKRKNASEATQPKDEVVTKYWDEKTQEYRYTTDHEKLDMSNKFLPFVVENSTPLHMFKTLLSRSKGMNQVLIASIFHLILKVDIKRLRTEVKELPEMPLEKLYEELLIKRPAYRVQDEVLATYQTIVKFFPEKCERWHQDLQPYSSSDAMLFFCSMAYADKPSGAYTDFPYHMLIDHEAVFDVLSNIQDHIIFDDKGGSNIEFTTSKELRCFVLYHGLFRPLMEPDWPSETFCACMAEVKP